MGVVKFLVKLVFRILLIPVWIMLVLAWFAAMIIVRIGCVAKGLASTVLFVFFIGTLLWFRTEWMRYVLLVTAEGILFAILFAGAVVEVMLGAAREKVGGFVFWG